MSFRLPAIEVSNEMPFANDALDRQKIVKFVADIVSNSDGQPLVLAIDSPYGTGKSTFVEMLGKVLNQQNCQTVYFNAWRADHVSDPLIAMVAALDQAFPRSDAASMVGANNMARVKKVAGILLKRSAAVGVKIATAGIVDLSDDIEEVLADTAADATTDIIDSFEKEEDAARCFRTELDKVLASLPGLGKKSTLVFFIDELDRCRPDFAMSLLERVKHMFDVSNIAFVLSVDKKQLEAVTSRVYGEKIDATEYLRKFIDLEFGLPIPPRVKFIESAINRAGLSQTLQARQHERDIIIRILGILTDIYNMSLRAIERCIVRLKLVLTATPAEQRLDTVHVALLIVLRSVDKEMFDKIVYRKISPARAMEYFRTRADSPDKFNNSEGIALEAVLIAELSTPEQLNEFRENHLEILNSHESDSTNRLKAQHLLNLVGSYTGDIFGRNTMSRVAATIDMAAHVN